jgi:hypothetical protein
MGEIEDLEVRVQTLLGVQRQAVIPADADLHSHMQVWHGTTEATDASPEHHDYLHTIQRTPDHSHAGR